MWPFASRGARVATVAPVTSSSTAADYSAYARNDVAVKLWLPDRVVEALDIVSADTDTSRPDVLRAMLFEHIYGRAELALLGHWFRTRRPTDAVEVKLSKNRRPGDAAAGIRFLGKSAVDFKLWLPMPIKNQLTELAAAEGLGISDYLRKVLVYRLFGEKFHRKWQAAIGRVPPEYREMEGQP